MTSPIPPSPFADFEPYHFEPTSEKSKARWQNKVPIVAPRNHGVKGEIVLHNLNDSINEDRTFLESVLVEYQIASQSYTIFTVEDLFSVGYALDEEGRGNLTGDLAERITRRVIKYWLKHLSAEGDTGGIFDKRFDPAHKNGYIINNTDTLLLKIQKYPNIVLLKRRDDSEWAYDAIKELDGLFDYRHQGVRHIMVLETKLDKIQLTSQKLVDNLFDPFKKLFPQAQFHYILFSSKNALFHPVHKNNFLKNKALEIYQILQASGVNSLYFSFNETYEQYTATATHLITQYKRLAQERVAFHGTIIMEPNSIELYDRGQEPFMKLKQVSHKHWTDIS